MDEAGAESLSDRRPVVLVVEDESVVRMATSASLRDEGFDVIEASGAEEARRLLSAVNVDAVFSDVTMPGTMDGIGLAKWLQDHLPAVPILLTSGGTQSLPQEARQFGPVISKPYYPANVAMRIREAIWLGRSITRSRSR